MFETSQLWHCISTASWIILKTTFLNSSCIIWCSVARPMSNFSKQKEIIKWAGFILKLLPYCVQSFKPPACVGRFPHEGFSQGEPNSSPLYLPCKNWFFVRLQIFRDPNISTCRLFFASPHAKNYEFRQFGTRILHK